MSIETAEALELTDAGFKFWFNDQKHIRSPFPAEIHPILKIDAKKKFDTWLSKLDLKAEKEVNDEILAEKFEEILFELGLEMVSDQDDKLTIMYPFMPRVGDDFNSEEHGESTVQSREIIKNEKEELSYMKMNLKSVTNKDWHTEFELPV